MQVVLNSTPFFTKVIILDAINKNREEIFKKSGRPVDSDDYFNKPLTFEISSEIDSWDLTISASGSIDVTVKCSSTEYSANGTGFQQYSSLGDAHFAFFTAFGEAILDAYRQSDKRDDFEKFLTGCVHESSSFN